MHLHYYEVLRNVNDLLSLDFVKNRKNNIHLYKACRVLLSSKQYHGKINDKGIHIKHTMTRNKDTHSQTG